MIDARTEDTAALYALDLLDGAEVASFEAELAHHAELRALVDELRAGTTALALTAPPATPSPFLRERLLASVAARPALTPEALRAKPRLIPFSLPAFTGWATAAVFALAAGYFSVKAFNVRNEFQRALDSERLARVETQTLRNQIEAERLISQGQIDNLKVSALRIATLERQADLASLKITSLASLVGDSPEARAIAVWNPEKQEGVLTVAKLPALAQDKDYQLWVVDPQYPQPVDGGVFSVDPATGEARLAFKPRLPVKSAAKFAVSLERKGGVAQAEGTMMLLSQ
jgi:anti-sigma-K factor RskA